MSTADEVQVAAAALVDVPKEFHAVVEKHGRELWAFVMNCGTGGQATQVLAELAGKHRSRGGIHAVGVLASGFNALANELVRAKGWTSEQVEACDRDTQAAFAKRVQVVESAIILPTRH